MPARRPLVLLSLSLSAALAVPVLASSSAKLVTARDDCEPTSFNAVLGPDACVKDGDTTFDQHVASLASTGRDKRWRFSATRMNVEAGRPIRFRNDGGEFHTFSEVAEFSGGCIPQVNAILGLPPAPECEPEVAPGVPLAFVTTGAASGQTIDIGALSPGTHRFVCLIHPWMQTTIAAKAS